VLSGRGLCDEVITLPEESYRLWCVVVCDLETSRMKRRVGSHRHSKKKLFLSETTRHSMAQYSLECNVNLVNDERDRRMKRMRVVD